MKSYPSIDRDVRNISVYAFDKLDGSNIRAEWSPKKGFDKFGSRNCLLDSSHPHLGSAIEIFRAKFEKDLHDIFKRERFERATAFFEYFGESSFAGVHDLEEPHDVKLFDVDVLKKGLIFPAKYLKLFGHLDIARLVYTGNCNQIFVQSIKDGTCEGVTFEGVVCKASDADKYGHPIMFKVKSLAWIDKLKNHCKGDEKLFEQLL